MTIQDNALTYTPNNQTSVTKSGAISKAKLFDDNDTLMLDELSVGITDSDVTIDKMSVQSGGYVLLTSVIFRI